jgi:hypothetical protein
MGPRALNLLSARAVETAKPRECEFYLRDGGGLFVRVYPSGLRRACYRFDDAAGRTRRIEHPLPMGRAPGHLTLEAARAWRDEMTALRARGVNPVDAELAKRRANALRVAARPGKRTNRAPAAASAPLPAAPAPAVYPSGSFGAVANEFYTRVICRDYRRPGDVRRILDADLLPALGQLPIATLRLGEMQSTLNAIVDRGSPVAANRALLVVKKIMRYARTQGHIEVNPLADITRRDVGGKEGERDRALSFDELATFWRVIAAHEGLSWQVRGCLQLLTLTGQRIGETLPRPGATWISRPDSGAYPPRTRRAAPHLVHLPAWRSSCSVDP